MRCAVRKGTVSASRGVIVPVQLVVAIWDGFIDAATITESRAGIGPGFAKGSPPCTKIQPTGVCFCRRPPPYKQQRHGPKVGQQEGDARGRACDAYALGVRLVRQFEQRLDGLLDGLAARVFSGPLHPSELAIRLIRTADLSLSDHLTAHNVYRIVVADMTGAETPEALTLELQRLVEEAALERGWRMEGPATVTISFDPEIRSGSVYLTSDLIPGPRPAWAVLIREGETVPITVNRATIGRDLTSDVVVRHDQVSREHAAIRTEGGSLLIADLGSSNGTAVNGGAVDNEPKQCDFGSILRLADISYRIEKV